MEAGKKDIIYRYIRNLDDNNLLEFINKIYSNGYVDGYNGNDEDIEFNWLLREIYKDATK